MLRECIGLTGKQDRTEISRRKLKAEWRNEASRNSEVQQHHFNQIVQKRLSHFASDKTKHLKVSDNPSPLVKTWGLTYVDSFSGASHSVYWRNRWFTVAHYCCFYPFWYDQHQKWLRQSYVRRWLGQLNTNGKFLKVKIRLNIRLIKNSLNEVEEDMRSEH